MGLITPWNPKLVLMLLVSLSGDIPGVCFVISKEFPLLSVEVLVLTSFDLTFPVPHVQKRSFVQDAGEKMVVRSGSVFNHRK